MLCVWTVKYKFLIRFVSLYVGIGMRKRSQCWPVTAYVRCCRLVGRVLHANEGCRHQEARRATEGCRPPRAARSTGLLLVGDSGVPSAFLNFQRWFSLALCYKSWMFWFQFLIQQHIDLEINYSLPDLSRVLHWIYLNNSRLDPHWIRD